MSDAVSRYEGARVLVFGANGFIGRWVARALSHAGADLHLAARDLDAARETARAFGFAGEFHAVDVSEPGAARALVETVAPDATFNLAGYGVDRSERDPELAERINAALPEELALALAAHRSGLASEEGDGGPSPSGGAALNALVHVGSALEYGEIGGDLAEDSTPNATTLYGRTKLAGTRAVQRVCAEHSLPGLTARLFTVFGPGEHAGRLLPTLLESARHSGVIPLSAGTQRRDFTYVEDVARGLLELGAASVEPGEVVNLASGTLTSVRVFVETAARSLGIAPDRLDFGAIPTRAEEMSHDPVSNARLVARTGWKPSDDLAAALGRAC